jgi:tetratricopeptide (TPR) repeat protein
MQALLTARSLHESGQFEPAARLYEEVLAREEENVDALHLLGVLYHQKGQPDRAVELIGRAVALRPSIPILHVNLAEAYRARRQFDRAAGCCRTALRLSPEFPEALCNLGLALQGLGRNLEAADAFSRALKLRPDFAQAQSNLGITLRTLHRFDDALLHFRRAIELTPDDAVARTNLGQMLVDCGQIEEALPHCREAVRLRPDLAPLHHNLANALRSLDRFIEARASYLEAIRLDPNLAPSHAHLGLVLQREGRLGEAMTWLKQAVELEPNTAIFWEYLAELHGEREEAAEAIPCWERVLAREPRRALAHNGLGWALQEEGQFPEAEEHFREALRLRPALAQARLGLAGLQEVLGNLSEAEAGFREALLLQPDYPLPHARLATLLRGKLPEADLAALQQRLADPKLGNGPRARLLFGLAHVLDARKDYAAAAGALRKANALSSEQARRCKAEYDPADHERFVDDLLEVFGPDLFRRTAGLGLDTRQPVFVFGMPRSGTTLIEQVLASHSRMHGAGELRLARETLDSIPAMLNRVERPLDCVPYLDAAAIRRLAEEHVSQLNALAGGRSERVIDKMPDNYFQIGLLAILFPRATFIHCRRDLRDVALSCWMSDFSGIRWASDPEHIVTRIQQYERVMNHWRSVPLPVAIHEVDYEETVADLEGVARRLVEACGLEWDPACLQFHETRRPVRTASVMQVRQPIYGSSVARWKHYESAFPDLFNLLSGHSGVLEATQGA